MLSSLLADLWNTFLEKFVLVPHNASLSLWLKYGEGGRYLYRFWYISMRSSLEAASDVAASVFLLFSWCNNDGMLVVVVSPTIVDVCLKPM